MDAFYTPGEVASVMVRCVSAVEVDRVADFAVGDGALLDAARLRWPKSELMAVDVDPMCVLEAKRKSWHVRTATCDFLSRRSTDGSATLRSLKGACDVVLLNPPFSLRGAGREFATLPGNRTVRSRAMAFVVHGLEFLATHGELVALLPASTLDSVRDAAAWEFIGSCHEVSVVARYERGTFRSATAATVVIHVGPGRGGDVGPPSYRPLRRASRAMRVRLVRGTAQMHSLVGGSEWQLIHTTDLVDGSVLPLHRPVGMSGRVVVGPCVLIPRVGVPVEGDVAVVRDGKFVISDCILGLECETEAKADQLARQVREDIVALRSLYGGACARYITVVKLRGYLEARGVEVEVVGRS